jgi:radical SAM superfamily enzyme YgiQ (UPF0313 family)
MRVVLVSTYELGRQPFGLASPAAWLRDAGFDVGCVDLSRESFAPELFAGARLVAFFLPMHTATRLAVPIVPRVRALEPRAHLCAYGLYAPPNEAWLRELGVETILAGEFEEDLVTLARTLTHADAHRATAAATGPRGIPRLPFKVPDRDGLPPLSKYAALKLHGGAAARTVGYTEASRGCKHRCRHCPVVPIYNGHFRVVAPEVVLADIRQQIESGAAHITFGDPDFLNGPAHAMRIVTALHETWPSLTYDVTTRVGHLLAHADLLPTLRRTGCLLVTSAVESVDDRVLQLLDKGHTRADFVRVAELCHAAGLTLNPTFVAFTPWTSRAAYLDLLDTIEELGLVSHVAPIQLALRLLIPRGSRLLELDEVRALVGPFDGELLVYPWRHPDPAMDDLQLAAERLVSASKRAREDFFGAIRQLAESHAGDRAGSRAARDVPVRPRGAMVATREPRIAGPAHAGIPRSRVEVPYLDEPWYC